MPITNMKHSIILLLLLFFGVISCKKEKLNWDTNWSAPLVHDTLSLENLVNDSTLEYDGSGSYNVVFERTLADVRAIIEDTLKFEDTIKKKFSIVFSQLNIPPNFTFVDQAEENEIYPGDAELKALRIKSGNLKFTIKNPLQTGAYLTVDLPGAVRNAQPFQETLFIPAAQGSDLGIIEASFDMSGYMLDLTGLQGDKSNLFVSQVSILSDPNGQTVTMYNTDSISFDAVFNQVKLDYARGYFGNFVLSDLRTQNVDAFNIFDSGMLDIPATNISFYIENGFKLGSNLNINLVRSENKAGNIVDLISPSINQGFYINPATGGWYNFTPSTTSLQFNSGNSNIESFIENLGNKYTVGYSFEANPYGNISGGWDEFFPSSRIPVKMTVSSPLAVGMDALVLKDTFDISFDPPTQGNTIESASLILKTTNSFPFGADVTLFLINKNGNLAHTVSGSSSLLSGQEGSLNTLTGLMTSNSNIEFLFDQSIINNLSNITQVIVRAELNTINPTSGLSEQYNIPAGANMIFSLLTNFKMKHEL